MSYLVFQELQTYIGFTDNDAQQLRDLRELVKPHFGTAIEHFYETIRRYPGAFAVFKDDAQILRLKGTLRGWLDSVFGGVYDENYFLERARIGRMHVKVGLPQHFMFAAMEVMRQDIFAAIHAGAPIGMQRKLESVQKIFSIELAIMLETYKEAYVDLVRRAERTEMEERLTQSEHLARIGRLAAALAHEIKNPLAGISGAIQVIREGMRRDDPHRPVLNEILRQIDRLDHTVKDLLIYARPSPPRFERCDVQQLIGRAVALLSQEPEMQRLRLMHRRGSPLPTVELDAHQIEQVVLNLLLNAAHASPDAGVITISAATDGEFVVIEVEDRGQGMDDDTRTRATEAFFTTKAKGTGLGLSICSRIVDRHHGMLGIRSAPGKGTTVRVRLPISQPAEGKELGR